jgi:hypothetical protein
VSERERERDRDRDRRVANKASRDITPKLWAIRGRERERRRGRKKKKVVCAKQCLLITEFDALLPHGF